MSDDAPNNPPKQDQEAATKDAPPKKPAKPTSPPWYKRPLPVGLLILVVIVAIVAATLLWRHSRIHVTSDDAYVDGTSAQVSAQISGRVIRVLVDDNQDVKTGQALVELDPADYQARLDQTAAARAQAQAQWAQAQAQQTVYAAQVDEARASLGTAEANATNAGNQLERYQRLRTVNAGAVSAEQLDNATAAATSTQAQLNAARKAVSAAEAQLGYARSLIAAAQAGIGSADSEIAQAKLTLSYTHISAPFDGRIASKTVAEGNVVAVGAPLMAVVPRDVFITANFKETQLDHLRPGQPVTIKVDAYPELKLTGRVDSVEPASGQAFSLLPAQNATGNWVKVVQRVPVKIRFDRLPDDPQHLGPGMSVEVSVALH